MTRNRPETEKSILDAVTALVEERGFAALGVNAVAEKAGVAKVLIYRYFGGYEELLEEWALRHSYWTEGTRDLERRFTQGDSSPGHCAGLLKDLLANQVGSVRSDRVMREVLRWFLAEKNAVSGKVMRRIEERGVEISRLFRARLETGEDVEAMVSVLISGLYYLALISDRTDVFNGVPLDSEKGWKRLENAVGRMVDLIMHDERKKA